MTEYCDIVITNVLNDVTSEVLEIHRQAISTTYVPESDATPNIGASIDVYALVHKLVSHKRYTGNEKAVELIAEIEAIDNHYNGAVFKFAKPLGATAKNAAYHIVRKALTA